MAKTTSIDVEIHDKKTIDLKDPTPYGNACEYDDVTRVLLR